MDWHEVALSEPAEVKHTLLRFSCLAIDFETWSATRIASTELRVANSLFRHPWDRMPFGCDRALFRGSNLDRIRRLWHGWNLLLLCSVWYCNPWQPRDLSVPASFSKRIEFSAQSSTCFLSIIVSSSVHQWVDCFLKLRELWMDFELARHFVCSTRMKVYRPNMRLNGTEESWTCCKFSKECLRCSRLGTCCCRYHAMDVFQATTWSRRYWASELCAVDHRCLDDRSCDSSFVGCPGERQSPWYPTSPPV